MPLSMMISFGVPPFLTRVRDGNFLAVGIPGIPHDGGPLTLSIMITVGVFLFILGACVGSFLNVVIWRLPNRGREVIFQKSRGRMTLSWPPSHCPVCDAPIRWYQNIPVLSYLVLRGHCANCRTAIPIRYPLVELATAALFLSFYLAYFVAGWQQGIADIRIDWPPFALHVVFAAALLAAAAIDADLYIIPLSIPWLLAILGVIAAGLIGPPVMDKSYNAIFWSIDPHSDLGKAVAGAALGLLIANVLLAMKILPRSFASEPSIAAEDQQEPLAPPPKLTRLGPAVAATLTLVVTSAALWLVVSPKAASLLGLCAAILVFLIGVLPRDAGQVDVTDEVIEEISSPHVRREVTKELLFLAVPVACGAIAYLLPLALPDEPWLGRVLGSLLGLLVGGGILWLARIGGSLWLGKEAMGMGDAHLMAGIGAVIGVRLVIVAFIPLAVVLGLLWALVLKIMGKPNVLPFGPWLAVGSILALFLGDPIITGYFDLAFGRWPR